MKKFFLLFTFFVFTSSLLSQPVVQTGSKEALIKETLSLQNLSNPNGGSGQEITITGVNKNFSTKKEDCKSSNDPGYWKAINPVSFSYDPTTQNTNALINAGLEYCLEKQRGLLGDLNFISFDIIKSSNEVTISFEDVTINGIKIQNFSGGGSWYIENYDLSSGFTIQGNLKLTWPSSTTQSSNKNEVNISVGYLAPPQTLDEDKPVITNKTVNDNDVPFNSEVIFSFTASDANSNIFMTYYKVNNGDWTEIKDGITYDNKTEDISFKLNNLPCGVNKIYFKAKDTAGNESNGDDYVTVTVFKTGNISGTVTVNGNGVGNIIVKITNYPGEPFEVTEISGGTFEFDNNGDGYREGDYVLEVLPPLGFTVEPCTIKVTRDYCDEDISGNNFVLTAKPTLDQARGKGYWKHQFDVYLKGKGSAQELKLDLQKFLGLIQKHFITTFNLYELFNTNNDGLVYWSNVLSYGGNDSYFKVKMHLAALLLNVSSLKISQLKTISTGNHNVADAITEIAVILEEDGDLEKAKNIAEYINESKDVPGSWIREHYNVLYKDMPNMVELPKEYSLLNNYPNPFNPSTQISYALPRAGFVTLKIYDVLGNEIAMLVNDFKEAGVHTIKFDASALTSGVYLYQIKTSSFISTKKMILTK